MTCNHCFKVISRGKTGGLKGKRTNSSMTAHLVAMHVDADKARALREVAKDIARREEDDERKAKDETAMAKIPIHSLRTRQKRKDFLEMVSNDLCNVVILIHDVALLVLLRI